MLSDHVFARFTILLPDAAIRFSGKFNAWIYRASRGRVAGRWAHEPILVLTTTGRRSGEWRSTTVLYHADGEHLIVIGSNTGSDRPPAWALNLVANPDAEVQIRSERFPVRARVAEGDERAALWAVMNDIYAGFGEYRERTDRDLLVFVLTPNATSSPPA
jgi:deazaflavin-dependent oxidoreductase (nitroreductase family)